MASANPNRDFHHPYEPYKIQLQFMNAVYDCLENGKVGIFESPTGTGKSLSLICGSLTWLRDHKRQKFEQGFAVDTGDSGDPKWLVEHAQKQRRQEATRRLQVFNDRIAKIKAKERRAKDRYTADEPRFKKQKTGISEDQSDDDEAQFALVEYESDDESRRRAEIGTVDESGLSAETQALMQSLGLSIGGSKEEDLEAPDETKIFFCSRTHSQLTQFAGEINRVRLPPVITTDDQASYSDETALVEDVKYLTLGSRKNLCINPKVNRLGNATAINERCLEMQQSSASSSGKCKYMPTKDSEVLVHDFRDNVLAKVRDIEDLGALGKTLGVCPYYASRSVTKYSEVVTLPYPLLLQRTAREAIGLSLKNHVVIIDEAHNLMDAIAGIYSVSVTLEQVRQARMQLTAYLQRFRNRLKGKNRVYVAQTIRILDSIINYLQSIDADVKAIDGVVDMVSIMSGKGVDQINIFKLNSYLQESKLARKVDGYTTFVEKEESSKGNSSKTSTSSRMLRQNVPVLMHVQAFLMSLMNPSAEGRFFFTKDENTGLALKYMLLDPTFHFKDIVEDARAVVLAGGTMSPMSDYEHHLLSYLGSTKIQTLSCGHVIPPSHLLAIPVVQAPSGTDFDFTFEGRNKEKTIIDLGQTILVISQHIPDGIVVFFPSYAYLDVCIAAWKRLLAPGTKSSVWERLVQVKPVFLEERSEQQAGNQPSASKEAVVDSVLSSYSAAITSGNGRGALLFAVVGGTLSEGINFSDALGRGVVVVGLPFPNPHSAEWKAKMQYISAKTAGMGGDGKAAAREYYENVCMRSVNQCVGRAIRHKGDYAAIMMIDRRYGSQRIQAKLPKWIRDSLVCGAGVAGLGMKLDKFFGEKKVVTAG